MLILYIETNFLMAVAKGRNLDAEKLLRNLSPFIRLAVPAICYVEAINTYKIDKQNQLKFQAEMEKQINFDNNIIKDISNKIFTETETLLIKNDLMDNLILQCIVSHANQHPNNQKVFISGNTKDFGKKEVQEILNSAKIKYFSNTKNFLGWLESQLS